MVVNKISMKPINQLNFSFSIIRIKQGYYLHLLGEIYCPEDKNKSLNLKLLPFYGSQADFYQP